MLSMPIQLFADDFDAGLAPFSITVEYDSVSKTIPYREFALFHLPGEEVRIRARGAMPGEYRLLLEGVQLTETAPGDWRWRAPVSAGLNRVELTRRDGESIRLNLFVKRHFSQVENGYLNGYRIGHYPMPSANASTIHQPPRGFIEVTQDMLDVRVSPHFTLGQFLCKQQPGHWPKYLVLQPSLVLKLELLLEAVNRRGIRSDSLFVMSGYRTPWYNQSIGNVTFSRHVWGAGRMDDLTGNGTSDLKEVRILQRIVDETFADPPSAQLVGGLGLYGPRPHRGPFIHVDVRSEEVRWEVP
jgi:hypothetical protein